MKIAGTACLAAPPEQVWDAFHDPTVLASCLPGCDTLTVTGPDTYAMRVTAGVAAIKGTYDGTIAVADQEHSRSFTLKAAGAGAPGTVEADIVVLLAEADGGGTLLTYDADASVGGAVGGVGQRMLSGVSRKMAGQFFTAVDAHIAGVPPTIGLPQALEPPPVEAAQPAARATAPALGTEPGGIPTGAAPAAGSVYAGRGAPGAQAAPSRVRDFALGTMTGGAVALLGVVVGWAIGRG